MKIHDIKYPLYNKYAEFEEMFEHMLDRYNELAIILNDPKNNHDKILQKEIILIQADFLRCEEILKLLYPQVFESINRAIKDIRDFKLKFFKEFGFDDVQ